MTHINLSPDEIDMIVDALDKIRDNAEVIGYKQVGVTIKLSLTQLHALNALADMLGTK